MAIPIGKALSILAIGLMFLAYSNFIPTVFPSDQVADYVKNHFLREIIFGLTLAITAIVSIARWVPQKSLKVPFILGSIVVLPFWIASAFGWSTGGLSEVWGDNIEPASAYMLHGPQVLIFYLGMAALGFGKRNFMSRSVS